MKRFTRLFPTLSAAGWGAAFIFIPLALQSLHPLDVMTIRFVITAICFSILLATRVIRPQVIRRRDLPRFGAMTFSLVIVYNLALGTAQLRVPACLAILVGQAAPILVILIERLTHGTFQMRRPLVAIGTWAAGTCVVAFQYTQESLDDVPVSSLITLAITPIAMAAYMVLSRPLLKKYGSANVCAQMFIFGGVCLAISQWWNVGFWTRVCEASSVSLLAIAGLVSLSTIMAYSLWFLFIAENGASSAATYLNLVPIFGFTLAASVLQESISIQLFTGGSLVTVGCYLSCWKSTNRQSLESV